MADLPAPPLDLPDDLPPEVCRTEAVRRARWADAAHREYRRIPVADRPGHRDLYDDICQVRQQANTLAALAGPGGRPDATDGTDQGDRT